MNRYLLKESMNYSLTFHVCLYNKTITNIICFCKFRKSGVYVEFDVKRPLGNRTKFTGKFINSNRMELVSSAGTIWITR